MSDDKELDDWMRRLRAQFSASSSRASMLHVDPDNPYEIRQYENANREFSGRAAKAKG